ncbi:MAG: proline racemase family protein [Kangiellaceae bacterium]|nr:proline racemase family protein [Kangiellaceae bacterium]
MNNKIKTIDSHTGGEPTRVIVEGGPELGTGSMRQRLNIFEKEFDQIRSGLVNEPRGSSFMVGALLCEPVDKKHAAGVIFFNNAGFIGMCGHGLIGLAVTLFYQNKIALGNHTVETPVGVVSFELLSANKVRIQNVPSYRLIKEQSISVKELGKITGDIAWGGNWFFLIKEHGLEITLENTEQLLNYTKTVKQALADNNITGINGEEIDHIELFCNKNTTNNADSRNFVLCPGNEYDRSPCGTGTSAKLACLFEDGHLKEGKIWRQQSVVGSIFEGTIELVDGKQTPSITGNAFITLESDVIFDEDDCYRFGL